MCRRGKGIPKGKMYTWRLVCMETNNHWVLHALTRCPNTVLSSFYILTCFIFTVTSSFLKEKRYYYHSLCLRRAGKAPCGQAEKGLPSIALSRLWGAIFFFSFSFLFFFFLSRDKLNSALRFRKITLKQREAWIEKDKIWRDFSFNKNIFIDYPVHTYIPCTKLT